jgi:hypothetical protein
MDMTGELCTYISMFDLKEYELPSTEILENVLKIISASKNTQKIINTNEIKEDDVNNLRLVCYLIVEANKQVIIKPSKFIDVGTSKSTDISCQALYVDTQFARILIPYIQENNK